MEEFFMALALTCQQYRYGPLGGCSPHLGKPLSRVLSTEKA